MYIIFCVLYIRFFWQTNLLMMVILVYTYEPRFPKDILHNSHPPPQPLLKSPPISKCPWYWWWGTTKLLFTTPVSQVNVHLKLWESEGVCGGGGKEVNLHTLSPNVHLTKCNTPPHRTPHPHHLNSLFQNKYWLEGFFSLDTQYQF